MDGKYLIVVPTLVVGLRRYPSHSSHYFSASHYFITDLPSSPKILFFFYKFIILNFYLFIIIVINIMFK